MEKIKEIYNNQNENDLIFNYYPATYTRMWQEFIQRNNLKYITLHDLRHTNGSILDSKGVDIVTIAKRLGIFLLPLLHIICMQYQKKTKKQVKN